MLQVEIAHKGAEVQKVTHKSMAHKSMAQNRMWSGDPAYWGRVSPILFPIVGGLKKMKRIRIRESHIHFLVTGFYGIKYL